MLTETLHVLWARQLSTSSMQVSLLPVDASASAPSPASNIQAQLGMLPRYYSYSYGGVDVVVNDGRVLVRLPLSGLTLFPTHPRQGTVL